MTPCSSVQYFMRPAESLEPRSLLRRSRPAFQSPIITIASAGRSTRGSINLGRNTCARSGCASLTIQQSKPEGSHDYL